MRNLKTTNHKGPVMSAQERAIVEISIFCDLFSSIKKTSYSPLSMKSTLTTVIYIDLSLQMEYNKSIKNEMEQSCIHITYHSSLILKVYFFAMSDINFEINNPTKIRLREL